jgi:hypothetical protein
MKGRSCRVIDGQCTLRYSGTKHSYPATIPACFNCLSLCTPMSDYQSAPSYGSLPRANLPTPPIPSSGRQASRPALPTPPVDFAPPPIPPSSGSRRPLPRPPTRERSLPAVPPPPSSGPSRAPSQAFSIYTADSFHSTDTAGTSLEPDVRRGTPTQADWMDYAGLRAENRVRHMPEVVRPSSGTFRESQESLEGPLQERSPSPVLPAPDWAARKLQIHQGGEDSDEYEEEWEEEADEIRFFQPAFLSESAVQLRDRVERRRHLKAGIAWVGSCTGRDIVVSGTSDLADIDYSALLSPSVHSRNPLGSSLRPHHGAVPTKPIMVCRGGLGHQAVAGLAG